MPWRMITIKLAETTRHDIIMKLVNTIVDYFYNNDKQKRHKILSYHKK